MAETAADIAYAKAVELVEQVRRKGGTSINFDTEDFRALERIPEGLAGIEGLRGVDLDNTKVSDLAPLAEVTGLRILRLDQTGVSDLTPLAALTGLQSLRLNQTGVSDLAPLAALTGLQTLWLNQTGVSDLAPIAALTGLQLLWLYRTKVSNLAPIAGLTRLQNLRLDQTGVSDLTPIAALTGLQSLWLNQTGVSDLRPVRNALFNGRSSFHGLTFSDTPATRLDPELARLAAMGDTKDRTQQTLTYLKTLPPWPEPLPWLPPELPKVSIPQEQLAPLQVIEQDGVLHPQQPGDGLDAADHDLAQQGWQALRAFLTDLDPIRPRVDNHVPNLGRALMRLDAALGTSLETAIPVAIGTHGDRVIRLAGATGDTGLAADDQAELQEFAVALARFLQWFPMWIKFRDGAIKRPVAAEALRKTLPKIADVETVLLDQPNIDPAIPAMLKDLRELAQEDLDDPVAANGLLASVGNVLAALSNALWRGIKFAGRGVAWFLKQSAEKLLDQGVTALTVAAGDILVNKGAMLKVIAVSFPEYFGWLAQLLTALGL